MESQIRNFVIISHVDHGKSTLADRLLEITNTVDPRKMRAQFLDAMPLERERGITIKMQPVRMRWHSQTQNPRLRRGFGGQAKPKTQNGFNIPDPEFILNLIDTPGHTDFSYEVSRALAAVEGAVLLVDATQGVQAQTLANFHLAQEERLTVVPVVNKVDIASAQVEATATQLRQLVGGTPGQDILYISGKTGQGVPELLERIVRAVPSPLGIPGGALRALIFDSHFDPYKGIVAYVRIVDGEVLTGDTLAFLGSKAVCEAVEVGVFAPELFAVVRLGPGEIGYVATGLKEPRLVRVGDTITKHQAQNTKFPEALPGYQEVRPMVFASFYPSQTQTSSAGRQKRDPVEALRDALLKLQLNDAALVFTAESASALGRGFRCGFLGLLHLEIVRERLEREYGLEVVVTSPSVAYEIRTAGGIADIIVSAGDFPVNPSDLEVREPWVRLEIFAPLNLFGELSKLLRRHRGAVLSTEAFGEGRLLVRAEAPLAEVIVDFHDQLKSISSGYASMSYELVGYRPGDIVKLSILVAGSPVEALALLVPRERAPEIGRSRVEKLKAVLPRQNFAVALQAAVGGTIVARETIPALRKDVTGYLYGGDYTRKRKLLEKQKRGKAKLKALGQMTIPARTFLEMLKTR
ncbi:elongation factor 4 [Candidatus Parcubacteria bacterium]|nr:elongation factor 4 [Candidatus Parcubacteria bacterium]